MITRENIVISARVQNVTILDICLYVIANMGTMGTIAAGKNRKQGNIPNNADFPVSF
jgi:hypothetical protein